MGREQLEQLRLHGSYVSVPKGVSMRPLIRGDRDAVEIRAEDRPARPGDLVLYTRENGQGVIHRVIKVRPDGCRVLCGDNCWQPEYVRPEQIAGFAVRICRDGKWQELCRGRWAVYARVWTRLFFLRRPLFYLRDRLRGHIKKRKN